MSDWKKDIEKSVLSFERVILDMKCPTYRLSSYIAAHSRFVISIYDKHDDSEKIVQFCCELSDFISGNIIGKANFRISLDEESKRVILQNSDNFKVICTYFSELI